MKTLFAFFAALLAGLSFVASAASFTPLGFLPGGTYSNARAVSNDGKVIAGQAEQNGVYQGFYWHADTGMVGLGDSTNGSGVSGDGSYIVGLRYFSSPAQAYTFSPSTGISTIGNGGANGVSSDGNVIVGNNGVTPARWSAGAGPTSLGSLPCSIPGQGGASAASTDGSIIIGDAVTCNGNEAFRWTAATGMVAIGDLPLGDGYVEANDVSGDGSVIVGDSNRLGGREAFRWTSSGMVGLGTLPGGTGEFFSVASGVSADGNTIIGRSGTGNGFQVFIWTADGGMQNLNDVLISQGVDLQGYKLSEAFGISDDGTKIVGIASKGDGYGEAFLVDLAAGAAPAKCPDIKGKWGYQATEVLSGNQFSAVGRGTFRGNGTWTMKLLGALEGEPGELVLRGDYSIDSKCIIEATYAIDDSDEGEGPATGNMASIIINEDKMYMMLAGQPFFNANVIAKRLMSLK